MHINTYKTRIYSGSKVSRCLFWTILTNLHLQSGPMETIKHCSCSYHKSNRLTKHSSCSKYRATEPVHLYINATIPTESDRFPDVKQMEVVEFISSRREDWGEGRGKQSSKSEIPARSLVRQFSPLYSFLLP